MRAGASLLGAGVLVVAAALPLRAQAAPDLAAATELERQGRALEAAERYARVLDAEPTHLVALFGLQRTLQTGGALERFLPYVRRAIEQKPQDAALRGLELRSLSLLGRNDDVVAAAEQWVADSPAAPDPYRDWAFLVAQRGDLAGARKILERGHMVIGGGALEPELAQLSVAAGEWVDAARHWYAAVRTDQALAGAAGMSLAQTQPGQQAPVLRVLLGDFGDSAARRIAAEALVGWGRVGEAWALLNANLPAAPGSAQTALRRFAERARLVRTAEAARVRGYALERLASYEQGLAAQRSRIEAARAFADAGDRAAVERVLAEVARDPSSAPAGTGEAMSALIGLMADAGRPADAERRYHEWEARLSPGERDGLRQRIAWAWAREGALDRADSALGQDSAVVAFAIKGWIALFRGELQAAVSWFRVAGPYAGSRTDATRRTTAAALVQRSAVTHSQELGEAFLALERGDTAQAVTQFAAAAAALPADGGRPDVQAFAGRLALDAGDARAADLLRDALAGDSIGPAAPAAELGLAELAWREGRPDEARRRLERLILSYPESALVPQARRLLDQVRGAIPSS